MVDTLVSGASAAMHAGSSPVLGTNLVRRFLAGAASIFYRCLFASFLFPFCYSQSSMSMSKFIERRIFVIVLSVR